MLNIEPRDYVNAHRDELLAEAERERLVAQLPASSGASLRRDVALACYRLASWLDDPRQYLRQPEPGLERWALR